MFRFNRLTGHCLLISLIVGTMISLILVHYNEASLFNQRKNYQRRSRACGDDIICYQAIIRYEAGETVINEEVSRKRK